MIAQLKKEARPPYGYIRAMDFVAENNMSNGWASGKSKTDPDAFIRIGSKLYLNPKKLRFEDRELNLKYNSEMYSEFHRMIDDVYFHLDSYYNDFQKAKLMAALTDRSVMAWVAIFSAYNFNINDTSLEFIKCAKLIIRDTEARLPKSMHYDCDMYKK